MSERQTVLVVEGMTCASCVRHINHALGELEGVGEVKVNLGEKKVVVSHDDARVPVPTLIEALNEAGYESKMPS